MNPEQYGNYDLGPLIGSGGMGDVYEATDRVLGRKVAIKLIRSMGQPTSDAMLVRFQQEAQAIARLRSPHTIELYAFGASPDGALYYAMEFLQGCNLKALVEQYGPIHSGRAVHLLTQACTSLAEAHELELVHRDIKPANLFTARMGKQVDHLKVLDFGVVKHASIASSALTRTGALVGSPAYIAPEALSDGGTDHRADIYALGCVAYWLLSGASPFERKTLMAMLLAHASEEPHPLAQSAPQPVSAELSGIVQRCMAKDPDARPQTMSELASLLGAVPEAHTWTASMGQQWWSEHLPDQPQNAGTPSATTLLRARQEPQPVSMPSAADLSADTYAGTLADVAWDSRGDATEVLGNLERPELPMVGRQDELEALEQWLLGDKARLITLRGFGGAGKSRLAQELGNRVRAHFPDGVWQLSLARLSASEDLAPRVAGLFAVGAEALDDFLATRNLLLLVDNCEHVLDRVAPLATRLLRAPGVSLVATTREPIGLRQERSFTVGSLPVPDEGASYERIVGSDAVRLFRQHAEVVEPGFALDEATAADVARIVRTVAGIPLAIELAASRLRMLSPAEIAGRLGKNLSLLRRRNRDSLPHHQTLEQAIDWSFQLLEPHQQQLFRRLSVFRGSFTLEAVAALHPTADDLELLEALGELLNKSMVQQSAEGMASISRYIVLEPLRQFAQARIPAEELAQADHDHAEYFATYAERLSELIRGPEQLSWLQEVRADEGNLLAAIGRSLDTGRPDAASRISAALFWFWLAERQLVQVDAHLGAALAIPGGSPLPRAYALITQAFAVCTLSPERSDEALALVREGRAIFEAEGFGPGIGQARIYEGIVLWNQRELDACAAFFAETRPMMQAANFGWGESMCHWFLGSMAVFERDFDTARSLFAKATAGFREHGDVFLLTWALLTEGRLALCEGEVERAKERYTESLPMMRQVGDRLGLGTLYWSMAVCAHRMGDAGDGLELAAKAQRELRRGLGGQGLSWAVSNAPVETASLEQLLSVSQRYREALDWSHEDWAAMCLSDAASWTG